MTPLASKAQSLRHTDAEAGYQIPSKEDQEEFIRKADAFLARRWGVKGKFDFGAQKFVQEIPRNAP